MTPHARAVPTTASVPFLRRMTLAAVVLLLGGGFATVWDGAAPTTAGAATVAVNQCNYDETGAAREIECEVTVVNNINVATGAMSSTVATRVCAGAPGEALCVNTPAATTSDVVGSINQCNNSVNAGGSIVTCTVSVVNNITGEGSTSPATVNQCIGSGQGGGAEPTTVCSPVASATGADVIQCNTAGNKGGATERVKCTVFSSTVSSLLPVSIVQCNDSANGGGDLVTCTAQITSNFLAAGVTTTTTTTTNGTAPKELPPTGSASNGVLLATIATLAGAAALLATRRRIA